MYILINFTKYYGGKLTMAYENFNDLKDSVIQNLNACGWDDKLRVDLRSLESCIEYLTQDCISGSVKWQKSKSYKKFNDYRYGAKAMNL